LNVPAYDIIKPRPPRNRIQNRRGIPSRLNGDDDATAPWLSDGSITEQRERQMTVQDERFE